MVYINMMQGHGVGEYSNNIFPGFGLLLMTLIFLLIVYWLVNSGKLSNESALDILKKRYVNGEISKKEFHELKKEIKN